MNSEKNSELGQFTSKEIYESPTALKDTLDQMDLIKEIAHKIVQKKVKRLFSTGSGTSYHAGLAMEYLFNNLTQLHTTTEYAPEFPYLVESIINQKDIIVGLSQSGESKETIYAVKSGKKKGAATICITNNPNSELAKTADSCITTKCDKEVSVMATKTYVAELGVLAALAIELAFELKKISESQYDSYLNELRAIPTKIKNSIESIHEKVKEFSSSFDLSEFCFVLGAGLDFATAKEGALKLIEGAHMFAIPSSTAEFPHGPITLADSKIWVLSIVPPEEGIRYKHMYKLHKRMKERNPTIVTISSEQETQNVDFQLRVPITIPEFFPFLSIIPIQLLTLELSRKKGLNCDKPEALTKVSGI